MRLFREGKGGEVRAGSKVDKKPELLPLCPPGEGGGCPTNGEKGKPFRGSAGHWGKASILLRKQAAIPWASTLMASAK